MIIVSTFFSNHKFKGNSYIFEPDVLHEIAKKSVAEAQQSSEEFKRKGKDLVFDIIQRDLKLLYPKYINSGRDWTIFFSGGWIGNLTVLHASFSEYVIFFGSAIPTSGHSGRYALEVHDFVVDGEYYTCFDGTNHREVNKIGSRTYLGSMNSVAISIPDHAWMLEYGRGMLPLSLPFQMAGHLFLSLDIKSMLKLQKTFFGNMLKQLLFNRKL